MQGKVHENDVKHKLPIDREAITEKLNLFSSAELKSSKRQLLVRLFRACSLSSFPLALRLIDLLIEDGVLVDAVD